MTTLSKYKKNLSIVTNKEGEFLKSYTTLVAKINRAEKTITQLGWWSATTQKHINFASQELELTLIK